MRRLIVRTAALMTLLIGASASLAQAQGTGTSRAATQPRWSVEGAAGLQVYYEGTSQSVAFGFTPTRSITLLVSAERSHTRDRITHYADGYSSERGGTERFVSLEFRYAFFASKRVSPYVLIGTGGGTSRPNVNAYFPDDKRRQIQVIYYGGGVRIPIAPRFDALVDARLTMSGEAATDYFGVRMPLRAGVAWRF